MYVYLHLWPLFVVSEGWLKTSVVAISKGSSGTPTVCAMQHHAGMLSELICSGNVWCRGTLSCLHPFAFWRMGAQLPCKSLASLECAEGWTLRLNHAVPQRICSNEFEVILHGNPCIGVNAFALQSKLCEGSRPSLQTLLILV